MAQMPHSQPKSSSTILSGLKSTFFKIQEQNAEPTCEGRWTDLEHDKFRQGVLKFGKNWNQVAEYIVSRTSAQTRSHAQKYIRKLNKYGCQDDDEEEFEILNSKAPKFTNAR